MKQLLLFAALLLLPLSVLGQGMDEMLADFAKYHGARIEIESSGFDTDTPWRVTCRGFDNERHPAKALNEGDVPNLLAMLGKLKEVAPSEGHEDFFSRRIPESSAFMHLAELFGAIPKIRRPRELWDSLQAETRRALDENPPILETPRGKIYKLEPFARIFKDYIVTAPTEDFVCFEYPLPLDVRAKITFYPMSMTLAPKAIYIDESYVFFAGRLYHNTEELRSFLGEYE